MKVLLLIILLSGCTQAEYCNGDVCLKEGETLEQIGGAL